MVNVASANCGFLLGIFFSSFVNAFHLRDSILNDFCFFKDGASNWNNRNIYVLQNTHTHTHQKALHPVLVLHPSCVPEEAGVNQKGINKQYSHNK